MSLLKFGFFKQKAVTPATLTDMDKVIDRFASCGVSNKGIRLK
jgi:hypothetical protein